MMPRIALPVMCKQFRYTREAYGCERHGSCAHTADWTKCSDFEGVARAGTAPVAMKSVAAEADEFAEHCPCAGKPSPTPGQLSLVDRRDMSFAAAGSPADATFVWVYWHGGAKSDELRWSIRSVLANYHGNASIVIVGDPPPWYAGTVIPMARVGQCHMRRYRDQLNKLHAACTSSDLPASFTWMMDDTVFLSRVTAQDLQRHFYHGSIPARPIGTGEWLQHKRETFAELARRGMPQVDVCTHFPVTIEREKFLATWERYDLGKRTLQWELLYSADHLAGKRERIDPRLFARVTRKLKGEPPAAIINHSNKGWTQSLRSLLAKRFPNPAPFEQVTLKPMRAEPRMRQGLLDLIAALPSGPLKMVEVGSYAGESAETFAASGKFSEVHCVDCWATMAGKHPTADAEPAFDAVAARYPVIRKHKGNSVDAARKFENGSLDAVYIDASHTREAVKADIAAWAPKVKPGGILSGHDYCLKTPGVIQAVQEWRKDHVISVFQDESWLIRLNS